jgi:hypothetical protein
MREQLAAAQQMMAIVPVAMWISSPDLWGMCTLDATAWTSPEFKKGELHVIGQSLEGPVVFEERYIGALFRWVQRNQRPLEQKHGKFFVDFSTLQHTKSRRFVCLQVMLPPGGPRLNYMVPLLIALVSIATGRPIRKRMASGAGEIMISYPFQDCSVFPAVSNSLTHPEIMVAAAGLETLSSVWGVKKLLVSVDDKSKLNLCRQQGAMPTLEPEVHVCDLVEKALEVKSVGEGLLTHAKASSMRQKVADFIARPVACFSQS